MSEASEPAAETSVEVDPRLLEILVCPVTHGPLEYDRARGELISRGARLAYPILVEALTAWNGKQAQHALRGLQNVAVLAPDLREEIQAHAERCLEVGRPVTQKAARSLLKSLK